MSLILNKAQAEAVYNAMCALNKVGSGFHAQGIAYSSTVPEIEVMERRNGSIAIGRNLNNAELGEVLESYDSQSAFATAYGLDGKEPRTAVYTPGIGWQVQDKYGRHGNFETEAQALAA